MAQSWADEEDKELERFESNQNRGRDNNNHGNGQEHDRNCNGDHRNNYSGNQNRKRKPDNTVTAMSHSTKKGSNKHEDRPAFSEILKKQCPWHPYHKHATIDCYSLCRVMKELPEPSTTNDKGKNKVDESEDGEGEV